MRRATGLGLTVVAGLPMVLACGQPDERDAPAEPPAREIVSTGTDQRPYSTQLHVHGSFSEGLGSIDSHSHEASALGLDVIWWSDHDHRIASYRHVTRFGFEDWREPISRGEAWQPWDPREAEAFKGLVEEERAVGLQVASAEITPLDPFEGERSLRIDARSDTERFERFRYHLRVDRFRGRRPLAAGVTLRLAIRPERNGADGRAFVRVLLSEHAPREGLDQVAYELHYVLDNEAPGPERRGETLHVPLRYVEGEWNEYALEITRDAVEGFPFTDGEDNSLVMIRLGVESRRGARVVAGFDDLRIEQERRGEESFDRQRVLLERVREFYPDLRQHQGVEISFMAPHLNEFSVGTRLLDLPALEREVAEANGGVVDPSVLRALLAERAVEAAHQRGGLVSYNHPLGTKKAGERPRRVLPRAGVAEELRENRIAGADLLEVGYRDRGGHTLADHLWVWDELARNGLFPVGVGTSDSHGGPTSRWTRPTNNFVSWIYADSTDREDLLDGLRRGRVFFGDLNLFDGSVALQTASGVQMGGIVVTDREFADVVLRISGLTAGDRVQLVEAGGAGPVHASDGGELQLGQRIALARGASNFVRAAVHGSGGVAKVFSNPIHFVRRVPEGGIAPERAALDLAGLQSRSIEGFTLLAAETVETVETAEADGRRSLRISGRGADGSLRLSGWPGDADVEVRFEGLTGQWARDGVTLAVTGIEGTGSLVLSRAARGG